MSSRLIDLVHRFAGRRVLLVGDFMLDRYLYGNANRLSPEAPVDREIVTELLRRLLDHGVAVELSDGQM